MPYKIIQTIEKGQKRLCIIPNLWESQGVLRWPRKRINVNQLIKDQYSKPADNWFTSNCRVKRSSLSSYEEAIRELDLMLQNSDTEIDNATEITITTVDKHNINFNTLASQLVNSQPEKSISSTVTTPTVVPEATTAAQYVFQYVDDSELQNLQTVSVDTLDTHRNEFEDETPTQTQTNTDVNQFENYLQLILDNQNKIIRKLANLTVQIDEGFSYSNQSKNTNVVTLSESNPFHSEAFIIKPIDSVKALEEMELLLSDTKEKYKLLKQYSFVCSQSDI